MHVPPTEQKRIAAVARQARRLSGLIDSMLDVSKLTGGHLSLELAEVDVTALVREIVHRFTPDAAAAACPLTLRLDQPIVAVLDATRLDQIIDQPDRQRAEVRRRRARRDRGRRRRAGDPADRPRPRHRHLARRPQAHLPSLRARGGRAPVLGRRAGPLDHERAGQGAGRAHQRPQHPGRGRLLHGRAAAAAVDADRTAASRRQPTRRCLRYNLRPDAVPRPLVISARRPRRPGRNAVLPLRRP